MKLRKTLIVLSFICLSLLFATTAFAAAGSGLLTADQVNLRAKPTTDSERIATLSKGDKVSILSTKGEWFEVSTGGKQGWVHQDFMIRQKDSGSESESKKSSSSSSGSLKLGSEGDAVKTLQSSLIYLGYLKGGADGKFGENTEAAVKLYQERNKLAVDGIAGSATQSKVNREASTIREIISFAKDLRGIPYVRGGSNPSEGFDCSGFTRYVFEEAAGVSLAHSSKTQGSTGIKVPSSQIRAGDLVCFYSPISHVGLYIGGGNYIHSPQTGDVVKISELNMNKVTAIRRVVGVLVKED